MLLSFSGAVDALKVQSGRYTLSPLESKLVYYEGVVRYLQHMQALSVD